MQVVLLLVAPLIKVYKWIQSKLSYNRPQVYFEVEFEGVHVNETST